MRVWGEKLKSLGPVPLHAFANACKGREAKILPHAPLPLHTFANACKGTGTYEFYYCEGAMHPQIRAHLVI